MDKQLLVMVENLPFEATNQILRDVFAQFNPKWCRIVYRNNTSKGFAGVEFQGEDQALAACRQCHGAMVLGRPITCRMAEPRDRSWFDNPKQAKRRRERMEWERSGAGGRGGEFLMDREWGTRRDGGEFNRPTPQKQYPNYQAGPPPFSSPPSLASPAPGTVFGPGAVGGPPAGLEMMLGMPIQAPMGLGPAQMAPPSGSTPGVSPGMAGTLPPPPIVPRGAFLPDKEFDLKSVDIREHIFFFIDFNLAYCSCGFNQPIPVEMALLAFSFSTGEKASFHKFIDPGTIPRCYLADTHWSTNAIHGIPHHGFRLAEKTTDICSTSLPPS